MAAARKTHERRVLWAFVATLPIARSFFVNAGGDIIDNVRVGCNRVRTSTCTGDGAERLLLALRHRL